MLKIIKAGQLVTFNNTVYRCSKLKGDERFHDCETCDLFPECNQLPFLCDLFTNFKRVQ